MAIGLTAAALAPLGLSQGPLCDRPYKLQLELAPRLLVNTGLVPVWCCLSEASTWLFYCLAKKS